MLEKFFKKNRIDFQKNTKLFYYLKNIFILLRSYIYVKNNFERVFNSLEKAQKDSILERVDYYNKLNKHYKVRKDFKSIDRFKKTEKKTTYYFDLLRYLIYFPKDFKISYLFGDVTIVPDTPSFVKTRPLSTNNENSILMRLNHIRHFIFVDDIIEFEDKKDILIWRGKVHKAQPHRVKFMQMYSDNKYCDIGAINAKSNGLDPTWHKEKLFLKEHFYYKFILSLEGNDVASNLKWAMSSNSIVVMPKPKYESWFMEGRLIADFHYIEIKDDYSDLEKKLEFYIKNSDKAKQIVKNANRYVEQFKDQSVEDLVSYLALKKYFDMQKKD